MHPALAALTAGEAQAMAESMYTMADWCDLHHVPFTSETRTYIRDLAEQAPPPPPPPPPTSHPRRTDADGLRAYVLAAAGLPPMLMAVARLCLFQNVSLTQAGVQLGISRETVRVHLRRLRELNRLAKARCAAMAAWEAQWAQIERSRGMR